MEKSKRKIITLASLFLCCMAIVSIGFAAWVITGEDEEEAKGTINVDTVSDERYVIEVLSSYKVGDDEIVDTTVVLGGPETTPTGAWLTYDGDKQDLEAVIVVKVKNYDKQNLDLSSEITDGTSYASLVTAGYIAEPSVADPVYLAKETKDNVNYGIYKIVITFAWGTSFGGENPVTYFNGLGDSGDDYGTGTLSDAAFSALDVIDEAKSLGFTLTVYAKV